MRPKDPMRDLKRSLFFKKPQQQTRNVEGLNHHGNYSSHHKVHY